MVAIQEVFVSDLGGGLDGFRMTYDDPPLLGGRPLGRQHPGSLCIRCN
jgi:hypothetical protein